MKKTKLILASLTAALTLPLFVGSVAEAGFPSLIRTIMLDVEHYSGRLAQNREVYEKLICRIGTEVADHATTIAEVAKQCSRDTKGLQAALRELDEALK